MYAKHFFKMLLGLILMAVIGIGGLLLADHYSKAGQTTGLPSITTSVKTAPGVFGVKTAPKK